MSKKTIQEQFGKYAGDYVSSIPHARGASLQRLVDLLEAKPDWDVLDVATGAGHTAFAFAPFVRQIWATDITSEMLETTQKQAKERGFQNITAEYADAEDLPYADNRFDLLTCRIAAHHFNDICKFLEQAKRVLRPGGFLAVVDNVVPPGPDGDYINAFEKLRDPSHGSCLTLDAWIDLFQTVGITIIHHETIDKQLQFEKWAARHDPVMQRYLLALLTQAPPRVAGFLQPQTINLSTTFRLQEGLLIGKR